MKNLSPALLHKLDDVYDRIVSLYLEQIPVSDIASCIGMSDSDTWELKQFIFDTTPTYRVRKEEGVVDMLFNATTFSCKEKKV